MENQITYDPSGVTVLIVIHIVIAVIALLIANVYEKSIITDRANKYLFFVLSLIYSMIVPYIAAGGLLYLHQTGLFSSVAFRLCTGGMIGAFILSQILVYKCLNTIEIAEY
ncbi:hypothetical protein [Halobacillus seohaensis]|uniref:Uncharacterized protein n=1 Tax=Halobacillus seohaensis TaxID=447421 RepID=A0ABW2EMM0_9BACI